MNDLRRWFDALAPRERLMVALAAGFALLALVWAAGVRPLLGWKADMRQAHVEQQALLESIEQRLRQGGPMQPGAPAGASPADAGSLVVLVDRTTREAGLGPYLRRSQPDGASGVRLRFENAPFDALLEWLIDAQSRHALHATTASFDPSGEPGRVNANLALSRSTP